MGPSRWSPREHELLAVTLQLLRERGYERLTVDEVAATARASKATIYRRWPSKAQLVLAAFTDGIGQIAAPPDTGSLRSDLTKLGESLCRYATTRADLFRAVVNELPRNAGLDEAVQREFLERPRALMRRVLRQAVARGEIDACAIDDDVLDLLPGYLFFQALTKGRNPTRRTVKVVVDGVILPSLHW
ncbi:TetR/AcrR family transcriptional regulator [Mycobacterium sp. CVI_P3]|uniref:TetR/AcrR family transcriptional regulator n=1 Tax=Mycobacterium pinniadriaticum TaxID=2994102 RepID=A0ABT3SJT2_9MYCO|nr:TetR/AcrR family transcriptional regulator [Mycobacterium pinniadriaticum]MCX2932944.1 TetR/AcrR family transcriptional regulator [Mycobacterium pinniadriaticum]MCX2939384.1 TetR/AcrR family transcriptional regulator [Mycobacterium pinniadriaticum]